MSIQFNHPVKRQIEHAKRSLGDAKGSVHWLWKGIGITICFVLALTLYKHVVNDLVWDVRDVLFHKGEHTPGIIRATTN